ncbi:MAG TPA: hypothetical protein VJ045_05460, partial [Hyphomicrobiaceae bacterium]|nr:hypothetical protein [Hyphomicrobiaceae bacterium]
MVPFLDERTRRDHARRNVLHSVALLGGIGSVLALATSILWGPVGIVLTGLALLALYSLAPRVPPEAVMRLYRATPVPQDDSQLSSLVDVLAYRAELARRPVLYVIP